MARTIFPRVNWVDGQQVIQQDMTDEQTAVFGTISNITDLVEGSGVEKDTAVQNVLFDSYGVPASLQAIMASKNFDGLPIFPTDTFGNTVFIQPSDTSQGNQLQVTISDSKLVGAAKLSVYIFGLSFGGNFIQEVVTFDDNGTMITYNYYTEIVALMFQNFLGNQNIVTDGYASLDLGGRCVISEALPMTVVRDTIMAQQTIVPNLDYVDFKPSDQTKTLGNLLLEIANSKQLNVADLNIKTTATSTRTLVANQSIGIIVGEKFKATTNNVQKITVLLSVEKNILAVPGHEFDWSGDITVGIRALQTAITCPTDTIPGNAIEFDPEPSPLAEISLNQATMGQDGVILNDQQQEVDFVFTQSLLANPNLSSIMPGQYYVVTIRRSGDTSTGNIILQEAVKNTSSVVSTLARETVFSNNVWNDITAQDLWFIVWTDAIRITSGTAIDAGVQITSPKVVQDPATGLNNSFVDGHYSMVETSSGAPNYIVVQKNTSFLDPLPQPSTGNLYFSREEDVSSVSVVSQASLFTLINAGNNPIILGSIIDTNPVGVAQITGQTIYPGLVTSNTFTIINPNSDILNNNLVGSIITPNTNKLGLQYRIIKAQTFVDAYGDVNGDGVIDANDIARVQALDGYTKTLESATPPTTVTQQQAVSSGNVGMLEILRGNVTGTGTINIVDAQDIQQYINLGTPFPVGASFKRVIFTVESVNNPLTTTPNIIGSDSSFNQVPFTHVPYTIDVLPLWKQENLIIVDLRRFVLKTFTSITTNDITSTPPNGGKNSVFIPGDILLSGFLLNPDGTDYSIDLEVASIVLELPAGNTSAQVDIFNNLIRGKLKFFDGTLVGGLALTDNQVFVTTAIESITKDDDQFDPLIIDNQPAIDESISLLYSNSTGILTIRADNIRNIATRPELRTKIILTVYLKKAGFKNGQVNVSASQLSGLLVSI